MRNELNLLFADCTTVITTDVYAVKLEVNNLFKTSKSSCLKGLFNFKKASII